MPGWALAHVSLPLTRLAPPAKMLPAPLDPLHDVGSGFAWISGTAADDDGDAFCSAGLSAASAGASTGTSTCSEA